MNKRRQKERRKSARITRSLPLTFQLIKKTNKEKITSKLKGQTTDLSETGICMETNNVIADGHHVLTEGMDINNLLAVEIFLPKESFTLTCYTTVLRYDLASENAGRRLLVYLEIIEIEPKSQKKWRQLFPREKDIKNQFTSFLNGLPDYIKIGKG